MTIQYRNFGTNFSKLDSFWGIKSISTVAKGYSLKRSVSTNKNFISLAPGFFWGQDESDNGGEGPHMHSLNWNIDWVVEQ
jgi:hypothetical protein